MTVSRLKLVSALAVLAAATAGVYTARAAQPVAPASAAVSAHFMSVLPSSHTALFALQASDQKPKADDPLPPGKGKDVTQQTCSGCHAVTMFSSQRKTRDQWSSVIDDMVSKGLSASDQDLDTILNYLSTNLAPPKQDSNSPSSTTQPAAPPPVH